jgi:hypothetical protein
LFIATPATLLAVGTTPTPMNILGPSPAAAAESEREREHEREERACHRVTSPTPLQQSNARIAGVPVTGGQSQRLSVVH